MEMTYKAGMAATVAAGFALAAGQTYASDFYAGASVGELTLETSDSFDGGETTQDFEGSDTAFKIFGGYMMNDYFGVEVAYLDGGDQDDRVSFDGGEFGDAVGIEASLSGFSAQLVGQYPIGPVDLFAKAGILAWETDAEVELFEAGEVIDSVDIGDDGSDPIYGVGARYNFGQWGVRAEYEIIDASDIDDVFLWSIGVEYSFPL